MTYPDGSNRFDGIDFDNGAKPVGTASFGLDLRCGLLPNECSNEERLGAHFPFAALDQQLESVFD